MRTSRDGGSTVPDKAENRKRAGASPRPSIPKASPKSAGPRQSPGDQQGIQASKANPPPASVKR
jgi:hypothetical protein